MMHVENATRSWLAAALGRFAGRLRGDDVVLLYGCYTICLGGIRVGRWSTPLVLSGQRATWAATIRIG